MNAANNVSKALWGQKKDDNPKVVARRAPLRADLGITDASPFYDVRMRNNFEHFDNRLDEWARTTPDGVFVDKAIGPSHLTRNDHAKNLFRFFDPDTWELGFWGQRFDVRAICVEARRLMPPLEERDYAAATPPEG